MKKARFFAAIAGMIKDVKPAKDIITEMFAQADKLLGK